MPRMRISTCGIEVCALPDEETVQVGVSPFLRFPPVIKLSLVDVFSHSAGRRFFPNDPQEERAPVNGDLVIHQVWGKFKLRIIC